MTFLNSGFSQHIQINDTTYIYVDEDTVTKEKKLPTTIGKKIDVGFVGLFEKDLVKVVHNRRSVFSGTISTVDENGEWVYPKSKFILTVKKQNNLRLIVNDFELTFPLRKGYRLLYIYSDRDKIDRRDVTVYTFRYTNEYIKTL